MKSKMHLSTQFFEIIPDPGCILSQDGCFMASNPAWQKILGYTQAELRSKPLSDFVHPEDLTAVAQKILATANQGEFTSRLRAKNGEQAELIRSNERSEWAMAASSIGVWDSDLQTNLSFNSPTYFTMLGYPEGVLPAHLSTWLELVHPDDRQKILQSNQDCIDNRIERFEVEFRMLSQDGTWHWILGKGQAIQRSPEGKALRLIGTHTDITERKQTEENLRRSREDFKGYFDIGAFGMSATSVEKGWIEVNDRLCQMLGYTQSELRLLTWAELTHPDDLASDLQLFNETLAGKRNTYHLDKRFIRKDGGVVYTTLFVSCSRNPDGSVLYFLATIMDITERKLAEIKLLESEEKFSKAFQYAPLLFTISDLKDGKYLDVNDEFLRISGFSREEVLGKTSIEVGWILSEDRLRLTQALNPHGNVRPMQLTLHAKDGHGVICLYQGELLTVNGQTRLLSIAHDITDQKQAEIALQNSEANFRTIFEKAASGYLQVSTEGKLTKVNAAMADMLGYTVEELEQLSFMDITHPADRGISLKSLQSQLTGERKTLQFEKRYLHRDGHIVWGFVSTTLVRDNLGAPLYSITNVTDITKRKQFEDALGESQARYQMVFENSGTANSIFDTNFRLILQNEASRLRLNAKLGEAIGKTALEIFGPTQGAVVTERMVHVLETGKTDVFETEFNLPVGKKWFRSTYQTVFDEKRNLVGIQIISQDISEQKKLKRKSENRWQKKKPCCANCTTAQKTTWRSSLPCSICRPCMSTIHVYKKSFWKPKTGFAPWRWSTKNCMMPAISHGSI
ncbi:MAG: PAS domain S-box protein [Holophaga sp.]|nr:PAS domain S-box protein [Holophaga sp.]